MRSGNKLTQKDNADSGVQFIIPAGPTQSLLLAKDPNQLLWKPYYPKCTAQAHIPKFLKPSLESVKGRRNQVTAMIHNQGSAGYTLQPTPMGAIKITKVIDYTGD